MLFKVARRTSNLERVILDEYAHGGYGKSKRPFHHATPHNACICSRPQRIPPTMSTCRFAPSTTGPVHPGTLLAALLCWLDARSRNARLILRLEDLDPERCRPELSRALVEDLAWFGLDWDAVVEQSTLHHQHEAALDHLAAAGRLYPSSISRSALKTLGRRAPDGGWAYDNSERNRSLPSEGWRSCPEPLRVRLDNGALTLSDESGLDLSQDPALAFGDPVLKRRDGAVAYQLAVVVDDAAAGIRRVVRGRDIATGTATQVAVQKLLGLPAPIYRHHLLLLENHEQKLAKFHGSVGAPELRRHYRAEELCGWLAWCCGLLATPQPCRPAELLPDFSWRHVHHDDVVVSWDGTRLNAEPRDRRAPARQVGMLKYSACRASAWRSRQKNLESASFSWLTPAAPAAIAVVLVPALPALCDRPLPPPGRARFVRVSDARGVAVDEAVAVRVSETTMEFMVHGGAGIRAAVNAALRSHELSEAPSCTDDHWQDLAQVAHPAALRWRLAHPGARPSFPARFLTCQPLILITGPANVGKSTLLNAWCGHHRALVSGVPGTTRDLVTAATLTHGWRLRLMDSAGLRNTDDALEKAGQSLVEHARRVADLVIYLLPPEGGGPGPQAGDLVLMGKADALIPSPDGVCWSANGLPGRDARRLLEDLNLAVLHRLGLPADVDDAAASAPRSSPLAP